jgi:hypothetical protein
MPNIKDFVSALHASHLDNGKMVYYAAIDERGKIKPLMPTTPFIFEYFIYNSIYQIDWESTYQNAENQILSHKRNEKGRIILREYEQQQALLAYLEKSNIETPDRVQRAFAPLKYLACLEGSWTKIIPDHNLSAHEGEKFFQNVRELQSMLRADITKNQIPRFFKILDSCREFIGKVRNYIFHGAKSLRQISNESQSRRIELYHLIIQSINSLFFLSCPGIDEVATDHTFNQIEIQTAGKSQLVRSMKVLELFVDGMIKREDSALIAWATDHFHSLKPEKAPFGAMFYPSAGFDIITPILIGMSFCTDFYFYNKDNIDGKKLNTAFKHLGKILDFPMEGKVTREKNHSYYVEFEYAGVIRRIHYRVADNEDFLLSDSRLLLFFRRGDSFGEGGSDQPWDKEWFARWKKMIPQGQLCAVLTDGKPHGIDPQLAHQLTPIELVCGAHHSKNYYGGIITPTH